MNGVEQEDDPHEQLIQALRMQLSDLSTQVTQLNAKLVGSYNRVSDLEDSLHESNACLAIERKKVSELEDRVGVHQSLLTSGSLVSREEIAAELSKVMERATDEAAQRGQAEEARRNIERDLSDLSESLFGEAGRMVADARKEQNKTELRMKELEKEVRGAEEVVGVLQKQLRAASVLSPPTPMRASFINGGTQAALKILAFDTPTYGGFLNLISHIKALKLGATPTTPAPTLSGLLSQPFISRLVTEDSDPTLRLDIAPSLNWLTRRAVLGAIYSGQLSIEQLPPSHPQASSSACSLCGESLGKEGDQKQTARFAFILPTTIHTSVSSTPITLPSSLTTFPLCSPSHLSDDDASTSHCVRRLRTTCSLFAFIRSGVIDFTYAHAPSPPPRPVTPAPASPSKSKGTSTPSPPSFRSSFTIRRSSTTPSTTSSPPAVVTSAVTPPPVPPRRNKGLSVSSLWGAFRNSASTSSTTNNSPTSLTASPIESKEPSKEIATPVTTTPVSVVKPAPALPEKHHLQPNHPPPVPRRSMERERKNAATPPPSSSPPLTSNSATEVDPTKIELPLSRPATPERRHPLPNATVPGAEPTEETSPAQGSKLREVVWSAESASEGETTDNETEKLVKNMIPNGDAKPTPNGTGPPPPVPRRAARRAAPAPPTATQNETSTTPSPAASVKPEDEKSTTSEEKSEPTKSLEANGILTSEELTNGDLTPRPPSRSSLRPLPQEAPQMSESSSSHSGGSETVHIQLNSSSSDSYPSPSTLNPPSSYDPDTSLETATPANVKESLKAKQRELDAEFAGLPHRTESVDVQSPPPKKHKELVPEVEEKWEERTYREIARLREEMFLARIGMRVG